MAKAQYTVALSSDSETTGEEKSSSAFSEIAIGIDIGTQCNVAVCYGSQVKLLKNTRIEKLMRPYVSFKEDTPGGVSKQFSHKHEILSGATIFNMKRLIGRVLTDPVVHACKSLPFLVQTFDIGVHPFIASLVDNIWRFTTPDEVLELNQPIRNVVLTIPVSFSRSQLTQIQRACAIAGLHVLRLIPEPIASVHENMESRSEKNALIFNMGAGYCDVAVSATTGGVSQIKALAGAAIGGEDILQNMMQHLLPNSESLFLSHGINEIKLMAYFKLHVQVGVDLGNGKKICKGITQEEFEEVNHKVFEKCESLIKQCLPKMHETGGGSVSLMIKMHASKVDIEDLTDVILVGGRSHMPKIRNLVKDVCKREELYKEMNPLEAAVCGAALEGAVASGIEDPFGSLDLLTIQATPDGNNFIPIIPQNTTMPARKELSFTASHDNQTEALIFVYEDEGKTVQENHLLGFFKIIGIPSARRGVPDINVCMDIDASNMLRVVAGVMMPGTEQPVAPFIEVGMPAVDDGRCWCAEALLRAYGSTLDLVKLHKKV
ncbi:hypothetical protein P3X46_006130 [Hevea brasiliensis]|uniref:Heat shock 70 kDa protein 8 n=1 Tax=Hevea brasiliensis TaxID=3981 RepID=A0ABQ9MP90_HEVBR|nr:hypothetical protein P3X46_006130 [Hevea brasiliensis]